MAGNGFQVDLDALQAFQQGLGNLINEHFVVTGPSNPECLAQNTYLEASDFGDFPEAQSLASRYQQVRENITTLHTTVSQQIQQMQSVARQTGQNYQDADDTAKGHVSGVKKDGGSSAAPSSQTSNSAANAAYKTV